MVLQANKQIPVWGKATPDERIKVKFHNQRVKAKSDEHGNWKLLLNPENYGGPYHLTITCKDTRIEFNNVLIGEVWLCSGQSNMEMPLLSNWAKLNNAEKEVRDADYPNIRLYTIEKNTSFFPIDSINTQGWKECIPETVKDFSATAYFFGRKIHEELNVPVGLIHSSWGGTVAEAWTSNESLEKLDDFKDQVQKIKSLSISIDSIYIKYQKDLEQRNREIIEADIGFEDGEAIFAKDNIDTQGWMKTDLPMMWEKTEMGNFDGSAWFRKEINLSSNMASGKLTLCYGAPDDHDEAWFNGVKIGQNTEWDVQRKYAIPDGLAKSGKNVILIRILDYQGDGGFMGEENDYVLKSNRGDSMNLHAGWMAIKGFDLSDIKTKPFSPFDPNQPAVLFNAMINPVIPYTIQGVIWYQGESNANRAYQYRELFKTLITDWRNLWGEELHFMFVQLANYMQQNSIPVEDSWAELREAQTMALELPNTGMAVTIDIGDANDIHPGNKQDVGKRLALNALAKVYNKDIAYSGPVFNSMEIIGDTIKISFDHVYEGLHTSDEKPVTGFSIAGDDRIFYWAIAEINGNSVYVSSPGVRDPVTIRYAWSANPACNLVNSADLPASPFRTDEWPGITKK